MQIPLWISAQLSILVFVLAMWYTYFYNITLATVKFGGGSRKEKNCYDGAPPYHSVISLYPSPAYGAGNSDRDRIYGAPPVHNPLNGHVYGQNSSPSACNYSTLGLPPRAVGRNFVPITMDPMTRQYI
jgi:hypothetical protein